VRTSALSVDYTGWGQIVSATYAAKAQTIERFKLEMDAARRFGDPGPDHLDSPAKAAYRARAAELAEKLLVLDQRLVEKVVPSIKV